MDEAVRKLRIKISGCFNSCSHHHIADIGFYGISAMWAATWFRTSRWCWADSSTHNAAEPYGIVGVRRHPSGQYQ